MPAIQFKPESLGSAKAQIPAKDNSSGATLVGLGVELTRAESRAQIPGLCSRCLGPRDPRTSKAQYPNIFMAALAVVYFASVILFGRLSRPEKKRVALIFVFFLGCDDVSDGV